jgi:hypothetical protein
MDSYLVADRTHFFSRLLSCSDSTDYSDSLAGFIFPSPIQSISLHIYEFRFGLNGHLTYILTANGLAWIDKGEFSFLSKWLMEYSGDTYLRVQADAAFEYSCNKSFVPLWISGGMSRGPHMFHFGHFATDFLPAIRFIKDNQFDFRYKPIMSQLSSWHKSLAEVADLTSELSDPLVLKEPSEVNAYPHITRHTVCCSIFLMSPFMGQNEARQFLLFNSLKSSRYFPFSTDAIKPNVVFLSRRKTTSPRISNEDYLCNQLAMRLPRFQRIDPEEYDISELLRWLNGSSPVIVSAASSSLDPIMQYGSSHLRYIVLYSLSIKEVANDYDPYSIYAKKHGYDRIQRVYVKPMKSAGPSWDDPIEVDPIRLAQLITAMHHSSDVGFPPYQTWEGSSMCG